MMEAVKGRPTALTQAGGPAPGKPHLPEISSLAVLHGQQGQVVGSQVLHALRDIAGSHHIGVVQPKKGGIQ